MPDREGNREGKFSVISATPTPFFFVFLDYFRIGFKLNKETKHKMARDTSGGVLVAALAHYAGVLVGWLERPQQVRRSSRTELSCIYDCRWCD